VMNIAKALIADRAVEMKITGVRPGEKMHEILVSEEECHHTVRRGEYYVILPMLPELRPATESQPMALTREFSSENNVIDLEGTVALLHRHHLLLGEARLSEGGELLA